jgi:hypothetical protein
MPSFSTSQEIDSTSTRVIPRIEREADSTASRTAASDPAGDEPITSITLVTGN